MNLKIPVSITISINDEFISHFDEKLDNLLKFLKPLGYRGLELSVLEPEKIPIKVMNELLDSYQMEIASLSTGSTFIRFGYSLGHPDQKIRSKAIERLSLYVGFANEVIGDPELVIGLIRGRRIYGQSKNDEHVNIIESLKDLEGIIQDLDVRVVIEPINRFEIDSIHVISDAINLIEEANLKNTYPMIDTFHVNIEEDIDAFFDLLPIYSKIIRKVDLAGYNRRAPGPGPFNFKKFIKTLVENGYWRYFNVECVPKPSFEDVAMRAAEYLGKIT
ncbi:MAG: sugar phosphate isomerase/epimerase family protein [Promethearchaeota archaeon]